MIIDDPIKIGPETQEIECPCCGNSVEVMTEYPHPPAQAANSHSIPVTSEKADANVFEKFAKMRHLGVPLEAVKHKLKFEGLDINAFDSYMKMQKTQKVRTNTSVVTNMNSSRPKMGGMTLSMTDLLGQRKNLKKAKRNTKVIEEKGFVVLSNIKNGNLNSNVLVPTLQDIIGSMKSLKSTGIKLI